MTAMTLTTAPPTRRRATGRRPVWTPPPAVHGCVGGDVSAAGELPSAPLGRPVAVGVAPLATTAARLTRRGRIAVAVGFLAVIGGGLAVGQATVATPGAPVSYDVVTIAPGQTLWEIAQQVAPGVDPRATVQRQVAVNGLVDADDITAGDRLSVPVSR